ncbi:hypothetical protein [Pantoea ananatis]|nr:hypothetical protein [Pantoea ananatis]
MQLNSKPVKVPREPITLEQALELKAKTMKETREFFKAQERNRKLEA